MFKLFILSILFHIIDDFVFQPICLSKLKQKSFWIEKCKISNIDISKYKNDYKMSLFIHSLSWSIMIILPYLFGLSISSILLGILIVANLIIHYNIDNLKANEMKINLMDDQIIHFIQLIITYLIVYLSLFQ